jgi:hypothetical protein
MTTHDENLITSVCARIIILHNIYIDKINNLRFSSKHLQKNPIERVWPIYLSSIHIQSSVGIQF